jgi:leucyl aminopeptidase
MLKIGVMAREDWDGTLIVEFMSVSEEAFPAFLSKDVGAISVVEKERDNGDDVLRRVRVSLGAIKHINLDKIRRAGGAVSRWLAKHEAKSVGIDMKTIDDLQIEGARGALCEGLLLGDFRFDRYQSSVPDRPAVEASLLADDGGDDLAKTAADASAIVDAVNLAREWAHEPPNVLNPATLAEWAQQMASESDLQCKVLNDQELKELGAEAILAVGGGSSVPPRLIILEWPGKPKRSDGKPVILVGKAITFDTGGYTIKTRAGLIGSKFDKCGGAAVIGILKAVAALAIEQPVVGIIAAAENAISKGAYRPNDIITTLSGKTVEVISTDAEGRLILADALAYAQQNYKPSALIDIATLTGGVVTALGTVRAGLMSNDDGLAQALLDAGQRTHERLWRLPLDDDYFKQIKGSDSDIKNSGGLLATPVIGGVFLKQFVEEGVPWAHVDIAGVATTGRGQPGISRKATGFGVRLIVDYLRGLKV